MIDPACKCAPVQAPDIPLAGRVRRRALVAMGGRFRVRGIGGSWCTSNNSYSIMQVFPALDCCLHGGFMLEAALGFK